MVDRVVILWDIDGTLLSTARAGVRALELAVETVLGKSMDLSHYPTAGKTDSEIFSKIINDHSINPTDCLLRELLTSYAGFLPDMLRMRTGGVLPGIKTILSDASILNWAEHSLLTGNYEPCGWAKLRHYGIDDFFKFGWFCFAGETRDMIALRAASDLDLQNRLFRIIIGDTIHDVRCANLARIPSIGINNDPSIRDDMVAMGACAAFSDATNMIAIQQKIRELCEVP